jgi:hypothetical protein
LSRGVLRGNIAKIKAERDTGEVYADCRECLGALKTTIRFTLHSQESILKIDIASQMTEICNYISQYSHGSERSDDDSRSE